MEPESMKTAALFMKMAESQRWLASAGKGEDNEKRNEIMSSKKAASINGEGGGQPEIMKKGGIEKQASESGKAQYQRRENGIAKICSSKNNKRYEKEMKAC
jgi:hypothetical protein